MYKSGFIVIFFMVLFGWSGASIVQPATGVAYAQAANGVQNISAAELKKIYGEGVTIVDLRRQDEWNATGVIDGSIKLTAFDARGKLVDSFRQTFHDKIAPGQRVVLICRTGARSSRIASLLSQHDGYSGIYNVVGGIKGWIGAGYPVSK
jgi:peptidylprolyl isomerase